MRRDTAIREPAAPADAPMTISEHVPGRVVDLSAVDGVLGSFIDDAISATPAAASLWEEVRRASAGGKRIRPRLLLTAHAALDGVETRTATRAAAGFELLHTAFLIHDDVIDRDWQRRGQPNVAAAFRAAATSRGRRAEVAEHLGTSAAIIAGDLAIAGAVELVVSGTADPGVRAKLAAIASGAVSATAAGELMDVELASTERPDLASVLAMYEAKTGVYTFCAPLQVGAVLAGADDGVVAALGDAGLAMGAAYQIADDLLGTFGDPAVTGKSIVSDAREGKRTVLATLLLESGSQSAMEAAMRSARSIDDAAARLRSLIEDTGVRDAAVRLALARTREARDHLRAVPLPLRAELEALIDDLHERVR
jgi:geranylgeranyl diphosphate synthase type II